MTPSKQNMWTRINRAWASRRAQLGDAGQAAIVAVITVTAVATLTAGVLVAEVTSSGQAQQTISTQISASNALAAGEHAYLVALNTNPSLATCTSNDADGGTCAGLQYGVWDGVSGTNSPSDPDKYSEYYAFGNPQPTFDPTTHALSQLTVQVAGAAADPSQKNGYLFGQEEFTVTPANGFLKNVWWSNYESYNQNGDYSNCNYNWSTASSPPASDFSGLYYTRGINYNIDGLSDNGSVTCQPVYFNNGDYLFGPAFSNDSMYVYTTGGIDFGSASAGSAVTTADPNCLFVDDNSNAGMNGSRSNCTAANTQVAKYAAQANSSDCTVQGTNTSACNSGLEKPPATNQSLKQIAWQDGCLYQGPTQISVQGDTMTVTAPEGTEPMNTADGITHDCPSDGSSAPLPDNGVVYVDNSSVDVTGANPFDGLIYNTTTNVAASSIAASTATTLTATVQSASSNLATGTTVTFSYVTSSGTTTPCTSVPLSNVTQSGSIYTATATCTPTTKPTKTITSFKAVTSTTGSAVTGSTGQGTTAGPGTITPYTATPSYGSTSQIGVKTSIGQGPCSACYYGEQSNPDTEGDAFVNGHLSGQLTVGSANNVVVDGNITYDDCMADANGNWSLGQSGSSKAQLGLCKFNLSSPNDSLGLIANNYVEVNNPVSASNTNNLLSSCGNTPGALCSPSGSDAACTSGNQGLTIDAAILALNQSFVVNNYNSGSSNGQGCLTIYGSVQQFARGPVGNTGGAGYQKQYTWDPLLDYVSPPSYLVPSTPSWVFQGTQQTAGGYANNICPVLTGIVSSINWTTGASTPGAPIPQSCSTGDGTLPDYPQNTAPTPPQNVAAAQPGAGSTQVTVTWQAPVSMNGATLTNYVATASPSGATCTATGTQCTFTDLTPGTTYSFTVVANTTLGPSNPSAPSNAVVVPSAPSPPTGVQAAVNNDGSIQVTWSNSLGHGLTVSNYTVTPSPACPVCTYAYTAGSSTSSMQVRGLTGGTTYTFTVTATNAMGTSASSAQSNAVTAPTIPGAATNVTAAPGSGQATVSWTAPASGVPITGYYVITYKNGVAQTPQLFSSTSTTETITGLTNGTSYAFAVEALNAIGTGPSSAQSNTVIPANVPSAPAKPTASINADGSVTVTWTAPANGGSPITGYVVTPYVSPYGTAQAQTSQTFNSTATTEVVTGLAPNTSYEFKVAAVNAIGTGTASPASTAVTTAAVPSAPRNLSGTAGNGQVNLTWTAPSTSGSSAVNGYVVTPYIGGVAQTPISTGSTATNYTVTGLTNGTGYTFTVAATNTAGTGTATAQTGTLTPATTPDAPTGVAATANASGSVTVTWAAPANNGGAAITGYIVTPYIGATAQTPKTFTTTATSQTLTGLAGGQTYTFTVAATNSVGTGAASAPSNSVVPPTVAGAPTGVTATGGNTSASVSWTTPASDGGSSITGYVVTPYIGATAQGASTFSSAATTETVTGLTNGTAYTFKVAAINAVGTGTQSSASNSVTPMTVPGTPTAVAATRGNGQVSLSWTAPSNGGSAITGYVVTPYIAGVAQTAISTGSTAASYTVTGLTNGTTYTFTVAAVNGVGTGLASAQTGGVTPATTPDPPTGVTATAGIGQASVSWTAPANNGGTALTGYIVTPYLNGTTAKTASTFNNTNTTETITGLTAGASYTFVVQAVNAVGTGTASSASSSITLPNLPGAPTGVTGASGNGQVIVSWTAPSSDGGSAITGYTVTSSPGSKTCTTTGATSCTVTGLTNGTAYTFTVTATNAVGTGGASSASSSVTPATVPGAPTRVTGTAANAQVALSWTAPTSNGGAPITSYTVTPYIGSAAQTPVVTGSNSTSYTVTGLNNGTAYTFTVAATNGVGTGAASSASSSITPATTPGAPTGVTGAAGNGQATVSWAAPSDNGGSAMTGYTATSSPGSKTCTTTGTTSCTVTGLTNGTAYTFTVTATNTMGTGVASAPSSPTTPATTPGAPTGVTGIAGNTQVALSWTAPSSNGGSAITSYTITPYIGSTAQTAITSGSSTTTYTVTGLSNGTAYTFKVAATNVMGTGMNSSASSVVTPITTTNAPTGATAAAASSTTATVSWTAPTNNGGSAVTGYIVTPYIGSTSQTPKTFTSTATTQTMTGLTTGSTYTFTVAAINGAGTSAASTASNSVIMPSAPGAPTNVTASVNPDGSVTVNWTAPTSTGNAPITSYTITPYLGTTAKTTTVTGTSATTYSVTGLASGSAYTFKVAATNLVGTGSQSGASTSVTTGSAPSAATGVSGTRGNAQVVVSWTASASTEASAATSYTVTAKDSTSSNRGGQTCTSTSSPCTVTGLTNGDSYTFVVAAVNGWGSTNSTASGTVVPATVPGTPTNVTGSRGTTTKTVNISWTAPTSTGGSAITGYTVSAYNSGGTLIGTATVTGTTNNNLAFSPALASTTTYTFKVAATNAVGTGAQTSGTSIESR